MSELCTTSRNARDRLHTSVMCGSEPSSGRALTASSAWPPLSLRPWLTWVLARHAELGGMTEIRVLRRAGERTRVWSGCFAPEHLDDLVALLQPVQPEPRQELPRGAHPRNGEAAFYFSLQAVRPEGAEGRVGRLRPSRVTAKDSDIAAYTIFVVDVDPEREPRGTSATDAEKAAALEVAQAIRAWLIERGIDAMLADSGNGWHLLVPLVASTGEAVVQAAKDAHGLLRLLHARFSTPTAKVDTSTFNPSRILKLYGTRAVKGQPTLERPHRDSSVDLIRIPEDVDLFSLLADELAAFRAEQVRPPTKARSTNGRSSRRHRSAGSSGSWQSWRAAALAALPLEAVYGELLTGQDAGAGWLQCRDPASPSGDRHPSAGVADGKGQASRGSFHSFRTGETVSVFDFLVREGPAADFRAACDVVAELSAVPIPEQARPVVDGAAVVERARQVWNDLEDEPARLARLRDAIAALLRLPAAEREPMLQDLRALAGMKARVFDATVGEVRQRLRDESKGARPAPPPPEPGRPVVDYVINVDTVAGLFDTLVDAVAPRHRFFRAERDMVFVRRGEGPVPLTDRNLAGYLSALVEIRFMRATDEGMAFLRYGVLPSELARAFVSDPRVRSRLPRLRLYCRSPIFDEGWRFVGRPGYHPEAEVFYDGPCVEPSEGVELLCRALDGFHWKGEADLVNFVGAMLTALTMPHWGRGHPFLAVNGNKPGVGKTTLACVLGVIVEGVEPSTVSYVPDDGEFEKQLATRVEVGDRVVVIDNAKTRKAIASPVLERCITDARLNFRRLGSNTAISRPQNDIIFCLTMNLTALGQDLRRRALPVNLVLQADVHTTLYPLEDVVGFVLEHRLGIVAELAGMVRRWLDEGRPACEKPARHSTSQLWASTMDAVLRLSGFDGFLSNFEESTHAFDPRYELMLEIAQEHVGQPAGTAAEWAERLAGNVMEERFEDRHGNPRSSRSRATIMGSLFGEYLDTRFVVADRRHRLVREYPEGERRKPTYRFVEVAP